jgi:hypothetical protein
MRYIHARHKLWEREEIYRIYMTDTFRSIYGIGVRYADFFEENKETRTAPEIIEHIRGELNGSF